MVEKFFMHLNFRTKQGMIHRTSCGRAKSRNRLKPLDRILPSNQIGWSGPWDTYEEARATASSLSGFTIWDCSICHPIARMHNLNR